MPLGFSTLSSKKTIQKLFQDGDACRGHNMVLIWRQVDEGPTQVLFVASRKVGGAVQRNRAKRIMREAYRTIIDQLPPDPLHIGWIARATITDSRASMQQIQVEMRKLLSRAGVQLGPRASREQRAD
jgi:ribonuclease P protein component